MSIKPTRMAYYRFYIFGVILIFLGTGLLLDISFYIKISVIVLGIFFVAIGELFRRQHTYVLTDYRIIERSGLLSVKEISIPWNKIANYTLRQNFLERILGIGTINMESIGGGEAPEIVLKDCAQISKIKQIMEQYEGR